MLIWEITQVKNPDKIYWLKVGAAVIVAIITTLFKSYMGLEGTVAFMLGGTIYIMFSEALAIFMKMDRGKTLKIGIGAFVFIWVLLWTLFNTLLLV